MRRRTSSVSGPATGGSPLRSRSFLLLLVATFLSVGNYATLLSVVPLWAAEGGSDGTGVGATTGVMMGATVASQLCMGWLFRVLSLRNLFAIGAALMGIATPAYLMSNALGPVLAVSAVRGVGFGMVVVAGSALTADLIPARLIGKGVGLYGLSTGLPSVLCLPLGVWVAQEVGFAPVFWAMTAFTLAAVPTVLGVRGGGTPDDQPSETNTSGRLAPLAPGFVLMIGVSIGLGGLSTFLPLAIGHPLTASTALLAMSIGVNVGRLGVGAISDTIGPGRMVLPAVLSGAVGMAGIAVLAGSGPQAVAPVAAFAYGVGFGAVQNETLVVMLNRAGPKGRGLASTVWNMAYDGGAGVGAVLLGAVVALASHEAAFIVSAVLIAATAPVAWWDSRRT
ncbi:MFS transporter [Solicola gregarius]|uniref:MFS transporter n=1 Tax=Solicola gregarius TaxID=2908642 RepID=A0AA46YKC0_9ACTN|nr:MFS transporter [Solicola gregarius]UYM04409.1 MFS transporter [Solicola gregarius]